MAHAPGHTGGGANPLLQQTINQRLQGQGLDLSPFFDAQRLALGERSQAAEGSQQRQQLQAALATGQGRSGAAGAARRGIASQAAGQRRGQEAQLGLQEQIQIQRSIENALSSGLSLEQLEIQRQQLQEQIRQFNELNQPPGPLEVVGGVLGLGAGLFGAQGAFPNIFGGGGDNTPPGGVAGVPIGPPPLF